jgi:hypothetical protein
MAKATAQARVRPAMQRGAQGAGVPVEIAAEGLCLPMFWRNAVGWPGRRKTRWARKTRIDPIQVWINAERILIDLVRNRNAEAAGSRPQLRVWTPMP